MIQKTRDLWNYGCKSVVGSDPVWHSQLKNYIQNTEISQKQFMFSQNRNSSTFYKKSKIFFYFLKNRNSSTRYKKIFIPS